MTPNDEWKDSDVAFTLFLATITPGDFNDYEWHVFQWHRLRAGRKS